MTTGIKIKVMCLLQYAGPKLEPPNTKLAHLTLKGTIKKQEQEEEKKNEQKNKNKNKQRGPWCSRHLWTSSFSLLYNGNDEIAEMRHVNLYS